tara:strand:- start:202 stop:675 length:474 start_codon:yes stop_codon:yes gene_type:complete
MDKFPITINGEKKLRSELDNLTNIERPKIIEAISTAREHGDLKENAEYHAAREQQGFVEGRIKDIKLKLSNAEIVDPKKISSDKVVFSAKVELFDFEKESNITYTIVGDDEADIKSGLISINSPIARSMIGKKEGDIVSAETPSGEKEFEILKILYE